jgi:DNA-binding response OmpR family regulator
VTKRRILVVDDDHDTIFCLRAMLENKGYEVDAYAEPEQALKYFVAGKYDVVIADVKMPSMTGFQLARMIDSIDQKISIILMTAFHVTKEEFEKVMPSTKVDAFILKPIGVKKLLDHIETLIKHKDAPATDYSITSIGLSLAFSAMYLPSEMAIFV